MIYVFIDASNIWEAQKVKGEFLDLRKLREFLKKKFKDSSIECYYYTAYPAEGTRDYDLDKKHAFFTFLEKGLKFIVRKKKLKRIKVYTEKDGEIIEEYKEKGDMDVELTIDALDNIKKYKTAILFSGDSDFLALVTHLRLLSKKVYIFSSKNNISEELKTGGDGYFDILDIKEDIWRNKIAYRTEKTL